MQWVTAPVQQSKMLKLGNPVVVPFIPGCLDLQSVVVACPHVHLASNPSIVALRLPCSCECSSWANCSCWNSVGNSSKGSNVAPLGQKLLCLSCGQLRRLTKAARILPLIWCSSPQHRWCNLSILSYHCFQ